MSLRLVLDDADLEALDRPCPCGAQPGIACMRSGGAVFGGSAQRFGEYIHDERLQEGEAPDGAR